MDNVNDLQIFCDNILFLRKVHRLSQRQLAKIMGISVYCLRKLEQGMMPGSFGSDAILLAARHFHLRPARLFTPREQWTMELLLHGE